jgi:branched-chain amino acid transport system permease protein
LQELIFVLIVVILGGLASIKGTIFSVIILVVLPEALRFVSLPSNLIGPMRQIIYAAILLAILMYKPKGLFGKVELQ